MQPLILQALKGNKTQRPPIWFMRQAGRYLPEYNEIRKGLSFVELTQNVDLSIEVSLQPHRRFAVDGIIMFSDILTPLNGAGVPLYFEEKKGPILEKTIASDADLSLLDRFDPSRDVPYVKSIVQGLRSAIDSMPGERPGLLGFAGAPFTLASYLVEGGTSKRFEKTKAFIFGKSELYHKVASRLSEMMIDYLSMQLSSGCDAVQLFDSWGGILSPVHYKEFIAPYTSRIIASLREKFPQKAVILFTGNGSHLLKEMSMQKPDALSLDWRVCADCVSREIDPSIAIQGNMDPLVLYGSAERTKKSVQEVLSMFAGRPGYVFNLGHGIHPESPIPNVEIMVQTVKNFKNPA